MEHNNREATEISSRKQILELLFNSTYQAIMLHILLAIGLAWLHWEAVSQSSMVTWLVLLGLSLAARAAIYKFYKRTPKPDAAYWLTRFQGGVTATGLAWGAAPLIVYSNGQAGMEEFTFYSFVIAGLCAGAVASLAIDKYSIVSFIITTSGPLAATLLLHDTDILNSMGIAIILFAGFTIANASRTGRSLRENAVLRVEQLNSQEAMRAQQKVTHVIASAQEKFISLETRHAAFNDLLNDVLELTGCEYGFIGEVHLDQDNCPYLKTHAITNIAWNEETENFYEKNAPNGLEFRNTHTLFGAVLTSNSPVIANSPSTDSRASGTPTGHPSLNAFLGIPIHYNGELIAMIGLANKPSGFTEKDILFLKPITSTIGHLVHATRTREQKQAAENALQEESEHTQHILQNLADGVVTVNQQGNITYINLAALKTFGYDAPDVIGKNMVTLFLSKPGAQRDGGSIRQFITRDKKAIVNYRELDGYRKNGDVFPLELILAEIQRKDEILFIGIIRDITEKKRLDKLKSEFVSTVSHELRTPLTSISASLSTVESGLLGEMPKLASDMIRIASKNARRLSLLINDLLDFEKLSAGKMALDFQALPVADLLHQSIIDNQPFADSYQIQLHFNNALSDEMIRTDALRFQQIMSNLISNAVKYSPSGGTVDISALSSDNNVIINVSDKGAGIPEQFKTRIFQSFSQADSSDTKLKGGTGMGLAISKKLAESMKADIGFRTSSDEGTTFYIVFPIYKVPVAE
jgi:two-component system sensor kinase FixL